MDKPTFYHQTPAIRRRKRKAAQVQPPPPLTLYFKGEWVKFENTADYKQWVHGRTGEKLP